MSAKTLYEQVKNLPDKPGAYIFKDSKDNVIYVGKAKSLKKRVITYFQKAGIVDPKALVLREKISDLDFFITPSEMEALILECNLIKEYRPRFNVSYKDDKSYPYIAITITDKFPRIYVTRENHRRGRIYYGPYTKPGDVRVTLDALRKIFPLRACRGSTPGRNRNKPCLNYHIKRCLSPCTKRINEHEYTKMVRQVIKFLEGGQKEIIQKLEADMREASAKLEFEKAAKIRDRIQAARMVIGRTSMKVHGQKDLDVIASAKHDSQVMLTILRIRDNKLTGSENFTLISNRVDDPSLYLSSFIKQYYSGFTYFPREIIIEEEIEDQDLITQWLSQKRKVKVILKKPIRGYKRKLIKLAKENAKQTLQYRLLSDKEKDIEKTLKKLERELCLSHLPRRIEAFDISNLSGKEAVGSMIVFTNNKADKQYYRRFKIRNTSQPNDYAMIYEVVLRRLKNLNKLDNKDGFQLAPDLILIDGGKPQLTAATNALKDLEIDEIPVVALAKKEEKLYLPGLSEPRSLSKNSEALKLMQRVRDEAHRFALQYHIKLRGKKMTTSLLDQIQGVGPKRKAVLLKEFGSVEKLAKASFQDLDRIKGIPASLARNIYKSLHR